MCRVIRSLVIGVTALLTGGCSAFTGTVDQQVEQVIRLESKRLTGLGPLTHGEWRH